MKKLSFFLMVMLMSIMSFAAETVLFTQTYPGNPTKYVNGYTASYSVTTNDFKLTYQNINNGQASGNGYPWTIVRSGSKSAASIATITSEKIAKPVAKVAINFTQVAAASTNALYLEMSSSSTFTSPTKISATIAQGIVEFPIASPAENQYYRITIDQKKASANGFNRFDKVIFYEGEAVEEDPNAVKYTITTAVNDEKMGSVSGYGEYKEGTVAYLTATPNTGYEFVKWNNGSTENPLKVTVTENVTYTATFQAQTPITCSQVAGLSVDAAFTLGEFVVTYTNGAYTYIKDATGSSMIYAYDFGLKAGDIVTGFSGIRAAFNGLIQITPAVTKAQLTITAGTAPQPEVMTANPTKDDMNKYVKFEKVQFSSTAFSSQNINATIVGQTTQFAVRDQWKTNNTFVKGGTYEFIGAVSYYNAVQVNFISATKVSLTISATATGGKVTGTGEYMEGDEATLIATANEGYEFVNWTWADEVVCTTPEYTFEVEEAMSLVANFAKKTYTVTATAENGSVEGLAADGKYEHGAEATLTATAAKGYEFTCWTSGKDTVSTANPYKFTVTADVALVANFIKKTISYELNGGAFPEVKVPTNVELWGTDTADVNGFMHYYNHYYNLKRATQTIENVASFAYAQMQQIMTDEASEYKWLGDYIQTVATAAGKPLSTDMAAPNESGWRWSVWAFFNACEGKNGSAGIDFTEAGKPEVWGAAYEAEYGVVLPTESVDAPYTLPTPVKEGYKFVGWYDNAEGTGEPMTVIPEGWDGTLYAIWVEIYTITVETENGTVEGAGKYEHGAEATLTATAAEGYEFTCWTSGEDTVSTENPYKFTVTADVALVANFKLIPPTKYNVTVTAENGTVTGAGEYEEGAEATLTATAAEGYEFTCWTSGEDTVSTENPYKFTVTADVALVANFKAVEPEIEWMEMDLEITNLVTEVMEVGGTKYLQLNGRNDAEDADVTLFLNNYADVDDDYVVNADESYMTFGGMEFTVIEGVMTQTSETAKGTIYEGTVRATATDEEEGGTMYVEFALTMYAAPATVLVLTDAIVAINEKLGTLTFKTTLDDGDYMVELSGYTAPGVHEGSQICLLETPEVVAYTNYAETSVADGVITLKGEFASFTGAKFDLTISGKLPGSGTALENIAVEGKAVKAIINGQLIILKNGVRYNAQGQVIK